MAADLVTPATARIAGDLLPPDVAEIAQGPFAEALTKAMAFAAASVSPRTEAIYREAWTEFGLWCARHGAAHLPTPASVAAAYLAERSETVGRSSLRLTLAAIAFYHRRSGHPWISSHPIIASVMKGILRHQKRPVRPAAALTSPEIRRLLESCGQDPGGRAGLAGLRDRALFLTGFAGGLRRSELVALDREDLRFTIEGLVLRIRDSKTDQEGQGADVGIAPGSRPETCPVAAMRLWLKRAGIEQGPVFMAISAAGRKEARLTGNGVWKILRRRAALAGLTAPEGERLAPHGMRAGFITEAYLHGALDEQVMAHARQRDVNTTRRYRNRAKTVAASPTKLLDL
jgi:integrase